MGFRLGEDERDGAGAAAGGKQADRALCRVVSGPLPGDGDRAVRSAEAVRRRGDGGCAASRGRSKSAPSTTLRRRRLLRTTSVLHHLRRTRLGVYTAAEGIQRQLLLRLVPRSAVCSRFIGHIFKLFKLSFNSVLAFCPLFR